MTRPVIFFLAIIIFLFGTGIVVRGLTVSKKRENTISPTLTPTTTISTSPISTISVIPTKPLISPPKPTAKPTVKPVIPSIKPTERPSNSPLMNISYPSDGQSIEMNTSQTFCVVDVPAGGDTNNLKRKQKINDGAWTEYATITTLCYDPKDGENTISLQYKNGNSEESSIYTRKFTFHRKKDVQVSIQGFFYRDQNCNGVRDLDENSIGTPAIVRLYKEPEYSLYATENSQSDGWLRYQTNIQEDQTLELYVSVESPAGYKANPTWHPPIISFTKDHKDWAFSYPQVPNESVGQCQI